MWKLFIPVLILLAGCIPLPPDDSDTSYAQRSGMWVRRDALTGCQYLEGARGGITPRLDADGKHICKK